ncbi:hypothetical protein GCM10018954_027160 [Kutzneria kofuensis]
MRSLSAVLRFRCASDMARFPVPANGFSESWLIGDGARSGEGAARHVDLSG